MDRHVQHGEMVGHEEGVEFAGFEFLDQLLDVSEVEIGVWPGAGIAPSAGVDGDRPHECTEPQLTFCHWICPVVVWTEIGSISRRSHCWREEDYCVLEVGSAESISPSLRGALATKQSIYRQAQRMDCFVAKGSSQ